jgi:hypothetical protein
MAVIMGYLIPRIAKDTFMKSIVWNQRAITITPMENIEQTSCELTRMMVTIPHPNGAGCIK